MKYFEFEYVHYGRRDGIAHVRQGSVNVFVCTGKPKIHLTCFMASEAELALAPR